MVKRDIIGYFKQVDTLISELAELKDDIRKLVERYKQIAASTAEASAPEFTSARPAIHADHIGASTFIEKGWSLISLGDHAGAVQALQKALKLSPGETQAESLLGWAQMLHEDYDDALQTFQRVLLKEPANSLARINVGYICLKKRIFGEAIEHLSKAIRLDNDKKATLYAHFYLGLVYLQREMYEGRPDVLREDAEARSQPDRSVLRARARALVRGRPRGRATRLGGRRQGEQVQSLGQECQETLDATHQGQEPPRT